MSLVELKVPDIGGHENVDIIAVEVNVGDTIAVDDTLITLETDKATMDVPAEVAGVVKEVKIKVGVIGHRISSTDFILLRPYAEYRQNAIANVVTVVLHEYIHAIESCSTRSRALMKQSYETCIAASHIRPPYGFTL